MFDISLQEKESADFDWDEWKLRVSVETFAILQLVALYVFHIAYLSQEISYFFQLSTVFSLPFSVQHMATKDQVARGYVEKERSR